MVFDSAFQKYYSGCQVKECTDLLGPLISLLYFVSEKGAVESN